MTLPSSGRLLVVVAPLALSITIPACGGSSKPSVVASSKPAPKTLPAPAIDAPPPEAPKPPWVDIHTEGDAEWVAYRDQDALLLALETTGTRLGVGVLELKKSDAPAPLETPEDSGPPAAYSPATKRLAFTVEGGVIVRGLEGGDPIDRPIGKRAPEAIAFSPAGDRLALTYSEAGEVATVEVYDPASGKRIASAQPFGRVKLDYDSGFLLVPAFLGGGDRMALLLANDTPPTAEVAIGSPGGKWRRSPLVSAEDELGGTAPSLGSALAVSPDGSKIAAGNFDAQIYFYRAGDGTASPPLATEGGSVTALAYAPDGTWLVAAGQDRPLIAVATTTDTPTVLARVDAPKRCRALAVSPDGRQVAGACEGAIRLWDVTWAK